MTDEANKHAPAHAPQHSEPKPDAAIKALQAQVADLASLVEVIGSHVLGAEAWAAATTEGD